MLKLKLSPTKTPRYFFAIAIAIILIFSVYSQYSVITSEPMNYWSGDLPNADCGVVLTGAPGRVREGFEYLAQKKIKKLIVSGVYKDAKLSEVFPYFGFYPEINPEDVILEKRSETTFGNAQQSLGFVEGLRCRDIVLMTSQIHMHRAYRIFKSTFPEQIDIKKVSLPNSKAEKDVWDLGLELAKSMLYSVLRFLV